MKTRGYEKSPAHFLWKTGVLVRKDFIDELSYRFSFFMESGSILFYSVTFFFVARVFDAGASPYLSRYQGDYFSFVLIGLAMASFMNICMETFSELIRTEQSLGTLETLVAAPTSIYHVFFARLVWNFSHAMSHVILYLIFGVCFLSASYKASSIPAAIIVLFLSLVAFNSIGMISAAFILVFKRGNPLNIFLGFATAFLGGVYFPVEVFPESLRAVSAFVPLTYTVRLLRESAIRGASFSEMTHDLAALAIMCAVLAPLGLWSFSAAMRRAKRDGTLSHY